MGNVRQCIVIPYQIVPFAENVEFGGISVPVLDILITPGDLLMRN